MGSIKLKFRPSTKKGREGVLYYQVIHQRLVRQIKTQHKLLPEEWNKSKSEIVISSAETVRVDYLLKLRDIIKWDIKKGNMQIKRLSQRGNSYVVDDIILAFERYSEGKMFFGFMQNIIIQLKELHKIRTSETYSIALNSFMEFRQGVDMHFDELNSDLLRRYELHMTSKYLTMNTISFHMRILRAVYNRAVEKEIVTQYYPFKHVYTGVDKTMKRAVELKVIKQIKELNLVHSSSLNFARDLFLFSLYTRGMSFVDIAYLKKKNLRNGILSYRRRKTNQLLYIKWEICMQDIIDKYSINNNTEYLLYIIKDSEKDARRQYQTALGKVNLKLKKISEMIGLALPLTMYVARHSWANIAKSQNIPVSVISEGMGHSSEATTQIYLASLDTSIIDRANMLILKSI